jgi:hypothetical protein
VQASSPAAPHIQVPVHGDGGRSGRQFATRIAVMILDRPETAHRSIGDG